MPRYRCNTSLVWDIEAENQQDAQEQATELLLRMLEAGGIKKRPKFTINRLRDQKITLRLAEFPPQDILAQIGDERKQFKFGDKVYTVRMNSHRYHTFRENLKCVVCGVEGTKMVLELPPKARQPHFNLYAIEGEDYVLMTKDHIMPVAHGGLDDLDNYQTMCCVCNGFRGADEFTIGEIRYLRAIYNNHRGKVSAEEMRKIIKREKAELKSDKENAPCHSTPAPALLESPSLELSAC